jgi:DNA topoisomerase-6 subunit B
MRPTVAATAKKTTSQAQPKETAATMAGRIREISISEFFAKNRHLLGFDNPLKSLLTAIREGVDNALDACEEATILPEITVQIVGETESRFRVSIEDNGPGILKSHLPNIFAKLLYGSKFHRLKQSRGQQGIGISAAVMYGQMTTGKAAEVISKTGQNKPAHRIKLQIDTKKNVPKVIDDVEEKSAEWRNKISGTKITITLEGAYKEGRSGVLAYLRQTALSNPHATIVFHNPKGETQTFPRIVNEAPPLPKEIKPHPHGVELGTLIQWLHDAKRKTIGTVLAEEFSRTTGHVVGDICKGAGLTQRQIASSLSRTEVERLYKSMQETKILAPPTNCLSPLGEESLLKALYWLFVQSKGWEEEDKPVEEPVVATKGKKLKQAELFEEETKPEPKDPIAKVATLEKDEEGSIASEAGDYFVTALTRPPSVYRGNPFQVEVGIFYGKGLKADSLAQAFRYANRVPLQHQAAACAMTKAMLSVPWKTYGLDQSRGAMPSGPVVVMMHIASVWVPYTSESKEAIAHYPEILKEFRLALMECGRRLQRFLSRRRREADEAKKRGYIEKYLNPIGEALQSILAINDKDKALVVSQLEKILEKNRTTKAPTKADLE